MTPPVDRSGELIAYRFDPFEVDLRKVELRKFGIRLRLEKKPWYLLLALLERPGELVSRSELKGKLWEEGVFVDFDHGLNVAVKKARTILGDSGEKPRYIETVSGEGYRFIAPVERVRAPASNRSEVAQRPLDAPTPDVAVFPLAFRL